MKKIKKCYELTLKDRTYWVKAIGVWTLRDVEEYIRDFRSQVNPIIGASWGLVLDVRDWQASPLDVIAGITDNSNWCVRNHLMFVVALLPKDHVSGWQFLKATAVDLPEGFVKHRVDSEEEARKLLQDAGYLS